MSWLYRLQQRVGLTGIEGTAAVVFVLTLAAGLGLSRWQSAQAPVAPDFYAAADAAFVAAASGPAGAPLLAVAAPLPASGAASIDAAPHDASYGAAADDNAAAEATPTTMHAVAEAAVRSSSERSRAGKPPPVRTNINTASAEQLQRLPRIGPALAQRIIEHRQTHGRFRSAQEITEVKGIGGKTFERLQPWIFI